MRSYDITDLDQHELYAGIEDCDGAAKIRITFTDPDTGETKRDPYEVSVVIGVSISGVVTSYDPKKSVTLQLVSDGKVMYTVNIAASEYGSGAVRQSFEFTNVLSGKYDMVISKPTHITYTICGITVSDEDIDLTASEKEYSNITLAAGDVNGDGGVNESDVIVIRYNTNINRFTDEAQHPSADVNGDGSINESDVIVVRLRSHINRNQSHCRFDY